VAGTVIYFGIIYDITIKDNRARGGWTKWRISRPF